MFRTFYHQLGEYLWHCKGIHAKWGDFVSSLNLLGLWEAFCGVDLARGRIVLTTSSLTGGFCFKLEFTGRHFEVLI